MTFAEAIRTVLLEKYIEFSGRAPRSEYWWFLLFAVIVNMLLEVLGIDLVSFVVSAALLIPSIAVTVRRFHDIGKSGWWILTLLIPLLNLILILIWFTRKGESGANAYGPDPLAGF